ncbi:hypothetical protein APUTEX25_001177 [Auxenochlorella protothecoides]|uniref:Uncharacterized protein n=1 Tax=Auxenochlorella protothecoides TaxID=3075 RepID=A0A3M7KRB4_AUXPR|nr:hypothetical protein APUTEX25_001177 [Auxenochlorella protothecoides]|eukprot:RMZ53058.1 hypothetical protein APUTEX25_001177 [Auxenochlorella protothecoides]
MQLNFRLAPQCNVSLGLCSLGKEESGVSSCSISHVPTSIETRPSLTNERHKGFSKSGSIRTSTLHTMGLSMSAIRVSTLEIMTPRSTEILVAVECLKAGQKACTADSNGNIGSDNKGRNNFCTKNIGDDNIVEFSAPSDSRVDITMVITTTGYTATDIGCKLLSANFTLLTIGLGSPPISTVTTIKPTAEMGCASTEYKVGSVYTVNEHQDLPGVAPLTLLFPSPPTPGPFPPPPSFGPITGTVSYKDGTFTFTMSTGNCPLERGEERPTSSTTTWTKGLLPSEEAFVAYAQVVAESSARNSLLVLTLKW